MIGFIRVMRPGSILGEQQEFLSDNEEYMWSLGDPDLPPIHACGDCLVMAPTRISIGARRKILCVRERRAMLSGRGVGEWLACCRSGVAVAEWEA